MGKHYTGNYSVKAPDSDHALASGGPEKESQNFRLTNV